MPTKKNKNFLKRYASDVKNTGTSGQGRALGIPALGAVDGSGDGSKYLGRLPRPPYTGDTGTPSQSADSGFSSFLSRVNKNFQMLEDEPMFPDQEDGYYDDLVNIYKQYDVEPLVTAKLPSQPPSRPSSMIKSGQNVIKESAATDVTEGEFANLIGDSFRQAASGFDGLDWAILLPAFVKNYAEIKYNLYHGRQALNDYRQSPTESAADELKDTSNALAIDIMDIVQILAEAILPSFSGTAVSIALNSTLVKLPAIKAALFGGGRIMRVTRGTATRSVLKDLSQDLKADIVDLPSAVKHFFSFFLEGIHMVGSIEDALQSRDEVADLYRMAPDDDEESMLDKVKNLPAYLQEFAAEFIKDIMDRPVERFFDLTEVRQDKITTETRETQMNRADLKQLIHDMLQEYIVKQPASLHPPHPEGYIFREPVDVDKDGNIITRSDKTYDDYAVIVPDDAGVSTYSPRANEAKIRAMVKSLMAEEDQKKKQVS